MATATRLGRRAAERLPHRGISAARARREAAHEWERAAARETPGKRRTEYLENAERNRRLAENEERAVEDDAPTQEAATPAAKPLLN